jgi:hypothetical protein
MLDVLDNLLDLVLNPPQAIGLSIKKAIIYSNRPKADSLVIAEMAQKKLLDSSLLAADDIEFANRDTGYSSIHLIFSIPVQLNLASKGQITEPCLFEVQIRDIFEEAWSEISHVLDYGNKEQSSAELVTEELAGQTGWASHLKALKLASDNCGIYTNLIEQQQRRDHQIIRNRDRFVSVTDLSDELSQILKLIPNTSSNTALRGAVQQAYGLLEQGNDATEREFDRARAREFYRASAEKFGLAKKLLDKYADQRFINSAALPIKYYLDMEQANAISFSLPATSDEFDSAQWASWRKAIEIYQMVMDEHPKNAPVYLRLGQCLARARARPDDKKSHELCRAELGTARAYLERVVPLASEDPLIESKDNGIYYDAPMLLAHVLVGLASCTDDVEEKKRLYIESINRLASLIDVKAIRREARPEKLRIYHRSVSNAVFWLYELSLLDPTVRERERKRIAEYLELMTGPPLNSYVERYVESLDNVILGSEMIGQQRQAWHKARQNMQHLERMGFERLGHKGREAAIQQLDADQKLMYERARRVVDRLMPPEENTN